MSVFKLVPVVGLPMLLLIDGNSTLVGCGVGGKQTQEDRRKASNRLKRYYMEDATNVFVGLLVVTTVRKVHL